MASGRMSSGRQAREPLCRFRTARALRLTPMGRPFPRPGSCTPQGCGPGGPCGGHEHHARPRGLARTPVEPMVLAGLPLCSARVPALLPAGGSRDQVAAEADRLDRMPAGTCRRGDPLRASPWPQRTVLVRWLPFPALLFILQPAVAVVACYGSRAAAAGSHGAPFPPTWPAASSTLWCLPLWSGLKRGAGVRRCGRVPSA